MPTVMQWVNRLLGEIDKQKAYAAPFEKRYRNEHVLPFLAREYVEVYPGIVVAGTGDRPAVVSSSVDVPKTGTAGVVVDALTERLIVNGLSCPDDAAASVKLMKAWEGSALDVMHQEATREGLIAARSFAVAARESGGARAVVGIESATQAAVHRRKSAPYDVDAYLKVWTDEWTGEQAGMLRLADEHGKGVEYPLTRDSVSHLDPEGSGDSSFWVAGEPEPLRFTGTGVVEIAPRSRLLAPPTSEIERITTSVDLIDLIEGLMVFAGHFGAVPIRYVSGLEVPRDPKDPSKPLMGPDGKPVIGFNPRADRTWIGGPGTKFGQLTPAGLGSFVEWASHEAGILRRQTKLPSAYFSLDLKSHMSAELLKTDEAPFVRRLRGMGRNGSLNHSWRSLGQTILEIESPSSRTRVVPQWADPETRIESQQMDQFTKAVASGMGVKASAKRILQWDDETIEKAWEEAETARKQRLQDERDADPLSRISEGILNAGTSLGD